jgi:hypothetical protein
VVNVHIHQFRPGGAVVDAAALSQFQEQWATYRKLVESDCLAQHEVGGILRATLNEVFPSPFSFLDIACGDASMMKSALRGTQVRHYHGIDLSEPALELAAANLAELPFGVDLDHRDFVEAMMRRPEHACGLVQPLDPSPVDRRQAAPDEGYPRRDRRARDLSVLRADASGR